MEGSGIMVNTQRLTVSKLSRLQKLTLRILSERGEWDDLYLLTREVAEQYEPRPAKKDGSHSGNLVEVYLGTPVLSDRFRASFSRSLRRLRERGLIKWTLVKYREGDHWEYDRGVELTDLGREYMKEVLS